MMEFTKRKLDKADRKILMELDKNCRISSNLLAKKVKKSRQTIEYRIKQLVDKGIITGFHAAINPHKMGYRIYKIYLKIKNISIEKKRLIHHLQTQENVYWMGECSGRWDLILGIFAKSDRDFFDVKNKMISEFHELIVESYGDTLVEVKQYSKMYFTGEVEKPVMFAGEIKETKMDEKDFHILGLVVNNARISLVDLAEKVSLSAVAVKERLKKLEKEGVIIQYRIGIDAGKLGLELYKSILHIEKYTDLDRKKLIAYFSGLPNAHYLIENIWQIELEFAVESYQEYYEIIESLKEEFPDVIRTVDTILMITDEWTPGFGNLLKQE